MKNISYQQRDNIKEIQNYLAESLSDFDCLDYYVEEAFESEELITVLKEDLPKSSSELDRNVFIQDITDLVSDFFEKCISKKIRVQIQIVKTDMCRLFHVDNIIQRLLCTYHGQGTQWAENTNVNRDGLGKGDNKKIIRDFSKIKQAKNFDVLVLKGEKYDKNFSGAVHRSPPLKDEHDKRVLLKIDEY